MYDTEQSAKLGKNRTGIEKFLGASTSDASVGEHGAISSQEISLTRFSAQ